MTLADPDQTDGESITTVVPIPRRRVFRRLTRGGQLAAFAWRWGQRFLFYPSPIFANAWRRFLLRCFGTRIDSTATISPSVRIIHPWNLTLGPGVVICHNVVLDCQAPITVGEMTRISQFSHLCTATHSYEHRNMPIIGRRIKVGNRCWLAADVFIGSGVTIGDRAILGARSSVFRDIPPGMVMIGSPARACKSRLPDENESNSAGTDTAGLTA
jgi:putative colanic acid biosynthesis acetyltransferase WcaF